ncbi:MAG: hypothetical protein HZB38_03425 [Planctomycetes bacterium]|nr:hypothetical protein [Planctomycetota bacterium]
MSSMPSSGSGGPRPTADNDIYTALQLVGFLFVLTATIYVAYRATSLFGSVIPPGGS